MRRSLFATIVLALTAVPLSAQQPAPVGEVADRIIAVVGDSVILKSDVDLELLAMRQANQPVADSVQLFKNILERRIGELVLLQAAIRDTAIKITDEMISPEVQKELDARRRQFGTEQQFQMALAQAGLTIDKLRSNITNEIRVRALLREFIGKNSRDRQPPPVTDEDVRRHYNENKASFGQRQASVTFSQVVIAPKASDSARARARATAEEALKKLSDGADFETVAKQYSEDPSTGDKGGDLGWFRSGSMVREFDQVVFQMRAGDISNIVETSFGYHIIKLERVRGAERQARHILIIPDVTPEDAERMRAYANDIANKARAGASIDSLIKTVGDPNEEAHVGPFPQERLPAPYNTALAGAQAGTVIGPLELAGAGGAAKFAIIKVTETRAAGEYSIDDPDFRNQLRQSLSQNALVEELISDLRKRTLVEYRIQL